MKDEPTNGEQPEDMRQLQSALESNLDKIKKLLPRYDLTLIASHRERNDTSCDIIMSCASTKRVLQAVDKLMRCPNN